MEENMDVLQFTAAISEGSSGGALFDDNGNVIGVTYASYIDGQSLNFAVPAELVKEQYDKKGREFALSEIYLDEYPYTEYLDMYKNVPEVTINELKSNPRKYSGRIIKVTAYVSSVVELGLRYISNEDYVSGDFDEDFAIAISNDFEEMPYISVGGSQEEKYREQNLEPGDSVCVIGKFEYSPKGSSKVLFDDLSITLTSNEGVLYGELVYKIQ